MFQEQHQQEVRLIEVGTQVNNIITSFDRVLLSKNKNLSPHQII